jgi:hypothetical protein
VDFAGPFADEGEKFSHVAAGVGELEGFGNVPDAHWHGFWLSPDEVSFGSRSRI